MLFFIKLSVRLSPELNPNIGEYMLKNEGRWEQLSTEEKLFLLAMTYQLPEVSGLEILYTDIMKITGFNYPKLCEVAYWLEAKNLIGVSDNPLMFYFRGDALTSLICGEKIKEARNRDSIDSKYPYNYLMVEPEMIL
jgi:hypothetical protein